jgi:hypothetical protein
VLKKSVQLSLVQSTKVCGFGILSNKWRIFQQPLIVSPDFTVIIVKACVVLHHFVSARDGYKFEDAMTVTGLEDVPDVQSVGGWGGGSVNSEQCKE